MDHVTALPFSPFINEAQVDPDHRWVLNENALFEAIREPTDHWPYLDKPVWSPAEDPPPLFISDPRDDFIRACQRDLLPLLEELARGA